MWFDHVGVYILKRNLSIVDAKGIADSYLSQYGVLCWEQFE